MNIELLNQLRLAKGGFLPLGSLAADPEQVLADLKELEDFGFSLEIHPYQGVAYRGPARRLCPDQIEWNLGTKLVGRRVAVWDKVTSTNDLASRASSSRANEGLVVLAEEQTAGRGRRGRVWTAPAGSSILMSVLLFPPSPLDDSAFLTGLAAVSVIQALGLGDRILGDQSGLETGNDQAFRAKIKWPNDIRIDGRKVAGILVERGQGTILGIGLNVNIDEDEFPPEVRETATSLSQVLGRRLDRSEIARSLIFWLDSQYHQALTVSPGWVNANYRHSSEHYQKDVVVSTETERREGRLTQLDLQLGLALTLPDGQTLQIPTKDVISIVNLQ